MAASDFCARMGGVGIFGRWYMAINGEKIRSPLGYFNEDNRSCLRSLVAFAEELFWFRNRSKYSNEEVSGSGTAFNPV